jgi:predicted amidophosphoribosyltransferase
VLACADCGHPLPADALFCANCGAAAEGAEESVEPNDETEDDSVA